MLSVAVFYMISDMLKNECLALMEWYWWEIWNTQRRTCPSATFLSQTHGLACNWTHASLVTDQWLNHVSHGMSASSSVICSNISTYVSIFCSWVCSNALQWLRAQSYTLFSW